MTADAETARELGEMRARLVMLEQSAKERGRQFNEMRRENAEHIEKLRTDLSKKIEELADVLKVAKGAAWAGGLFWGALLSAGALILTWWKGSH